MLEAQKAHPIEKVGAELRKQMSWIKPEAAKAGK
jgi:ketol-acid reductoisomerase